MSIVVIFSVLAFFGFLSFKATKNLFNLYPMGSRSKLWWVKWMPLLIVGMFAEGLAHNSRPLRWTGGLLTLALFIFSEIRKNQERERRSQAYR